MPITITRGYSFVNGESADDVKLNQLVERASISGITASDLGSILGISIYSAASGASPGVISYEYEAGEHTTGLAYAEVKYVIRQRAGQKVALFNPLGLETRRFVNVDTPLPAGTAWLKRTVGNNSFTLTAAFTYTTGVPRHDFLGSGIGGTSTTSPTDINNQPRIVLHGLATARVVDAGDTIRKYYYLLNATTGQWQHSPGATNTDKVAGLAMLPNTSGDMVAPMWLFGAPVWRA